MKIPYKKNKPHIVGSRYLAITTSTLLLGLAQNSFAMNFKPAEGITIDWDTTVKYGAIWRAKDQDPALVADPTRDDGNRNFNKGSLVSNRLNVTTEMNINYERKYGMFARARSYFDDAYHHSNDNDSPATVNHTSTAYNEFTRATKKIQGDKSEMLDYFVYGNFLIGGNNLNARLGSQVVSWGESLFVAGGISTAQSPADATQLSIPGVELKDIFLPTQQLLLQYNLNDTMSLEGYYQFEWAKSRAPAAGSFFSVIDAVDYGGEYFAPGFAQRGNDKAASDDGQFGLAFRYLAEDLNNTDFGFYYINYHDKLPYFNLADMPNSYSLGYQENIKLYGMSFGTVIGSTNVGAEYSYRDGMAVLGASNNLVIANTSQLNISGIHVFGTNPLADDAVLTAEVGYNYVHDVDQAQLASGDKDHWGFGAKLDLTYYNIFPSIDLVIPIIWNHNLAGDTTGDIAVLGTFDDDKDVISIGANFTYQKNLKIEARYTDFIGDASDDLQSDRDFYSISAKYSF